MTGAPSLPPDTHVVEIALTVADLARQVRFYTGALGLSVMDEAPGLVRLGDRDRAFLRLEERHGASRPDWSTRLFHLAILLPTRADLATALAHLVEVRHPLQGAADHLVSEAIYLADPEGNGIEIYRDRPREAWPLDATGVHMTTDPLDLRALLAEASPASSWVVPAGTRLGHVHLQVHDIPAAEAFYVRRLGFTLTQRYGRDAIFLAAGTYHHHIGVNVWGTRGAPPPPDGALGLSWFRIEVPDRASVEAVGASLETGGIPAESVNGDVLVKDPAGHRVVLSAH
jgi:catechol 2,3-dioxygenase